MDKPKVGQTVYVLPACYRHRKDSDPPRELVEATVTRVGRTLFETDLREAVEKARASLDV